MRELTIGGRLIADDQDCYVIAEIGHNHQGDVAKCEEIIRAAAAAGAHAVKLQKRDLDAEQPSWWDERYHSEHAFGLTYRQHRQALEFGWDEYVHLQAFAQSFGLAFMATAFDLGSLAFLDRLGAAAIKIGSGQVADGTLIRAALQTGRPLVISTGGATIEQVRWVYELWAEQRGAGSPHEDESCPLAILQCTSVYPCEAADLNLRVIERYRDLCPAAVIGLSDHYSGISMSVVAYMLGARIVEKHFTLHRAWKGSDQAFSLEPHGLASLVRDLKRARESLGDGVKRLLPEEIPALRKMGRSDI